MGNQKSLKVGVVGPICSIHSGMRAAIELSKLLSKKNEVFYCSSDQRLDSLSRRYLEEAGVKVHLFKAFFLPAVGPFPANPFSVLSSLKKEKFDCLCLHAPLILSLISFLAGPPVLATYYGSQFNAYLEKFSPNQKIFFFHRALNWIFNKMIFWIAYFNFVFASKVIGISRYTALEFEKLFKKKIDYIYLGGDSEEFKADLKPKETSDKINILSVSRLTPYKNFHLLIKIFKRLSKRIDNIHLTIIGSFSKKNYRNYLLSILPENAEILGDLSDEELVFYYQNCDIYATCDEYLFFGLPVIEAAFLRRPAVVLDRCAAGEVVEDGTTGFVVGNEEEFCEKLEKLVKNRDLRVGMGQKAREKAERMFTWKKCAEEYERKLNELSK